MSEDSKEVELPPHHEQQSLCATRLPYRQGRKLTAVKAYSINNESKHLLVFGVPALNLRQETKALFARFGKVQLNITKYPAEQFTETYHANFEDIQSARLAKKMLDTKNYYGGHLHISYAPELETLDETRQKLLLRRQNVVGRLKNLEKSTDTVVPEAKLQPEVTVEEKEDSINKKKVYMGAINVIGDKQSSNKRKITDYKMVKHCKLKKSKIFDKKLVSVTAGSVVSNTESVKSTTVVEETVKVNDGPCEVVDCTSVETDVITNINEHLNYNNFGKEVIRKVPPKPVNKIRFMLNKKSLL
ncbi:RNA-binding protein 48 [Spodoptera frugiperda]|uniref:RNA-binding protein 48 n=1 Tax=Spodoptera frugiperda TaxID=7108 RepID=A0A9R0ESP6_SPOFR|nr:RNA-binding protein 48 [Spodoptera frugiperda]